MAQCWFIFLQKMMLYRISPVRLRVFDLSREHGLFFHVVAPCAVQDLDGILVASAKYSVHNGGSFIREPESILILQR